MSRSYLFVVTASMAAQLIGCSSSSSNASGTSTNRASGTANTSTGMGGKDATDSTSNRGGSNLGGANVDSSKNGSGGTGPNSSGGNDATSSNSTSNTTVGGASSSSAVSSGGAVLGAGGSTGASDSAGSSARGGTSAAAGATGRSGATGRGGTPAGGANSTTAVGGATGTNATTRVSVLQHHNRASRDGVFVDAAFTLSAAANTRIDASFASAKLAGPTYAQPLYLASSDGGTDLVIVATEQNHVTGFNAATGAVVWDQTLDKTLPRSALATLRNGCGNIDPLGITGTPIIDAATRTIYLDAMTSSDGTGTTARHKVYAIDADSGKVKSGWPVDLNAKASSGTTAFDSFVQNQRGALSLLDGKVFVPFGGHIFDCSTFHGWVVGISVTDPTDVVAWATRALAGGVWAPGGTTSDGTSLFFSTGNTENAANTFTAPSTWQDGETVFRLGSTLAFSNQPADYWTPTNWQALDRADSDLGGTAPLPLDLPGATPSKLVVALGKDGNAYLLDRTNLGGITAPVSSATVATGTIINSAAAYTTSAGTFVVFRAGGSGCPSGQSGGLTAIKLTPAAPPTAAVAWCGGPSTVVSPIVSMTNGQGQDAIVWTVSSDNKLYGLNANTGQSVFSGGTGSDTISTVQGYQTPIIANGRLFVASNTQVYAFAPGK